LGALWTRFELEFKRKEPISKVERVVFIAEDVIGALWTPSVGSEILRRGGIRIPYACAR
jgi:hypothetical protein